MTQLTQTQRRSPAFNLAGVTLAAAMLVGIGGIVGARVQTIVDETARATAAEQAKWQAYGEDWERRYRAQQGAGYLSPHDKVVLQAAKEWEIRYRAMYPNS